MLTKPLFAQTQKQIEADLLKSFKKIDYWNNRQYSDPNAPDKLADANDAFAKKLQQYARHVPSTITLPFNSLVKDNLDISTSADGLFRIYSWDTWTGGTMHWFENIFQYKVGDKTYAVLDTPKSEGDVRPLYTNLYTFKSNKQAYYLAINISIGSTKDFGGSVQVFDIENGKLNDSVKLIKTATGLHSNIGYWCDLSKSAGKRTAKGYPDIKVDLAKQIINIPLIGANGAATINCITYKFNGQYFVRVKN